MIRVVNKNLDTGEIGIGTPESMSNFKITALKRTEFETIQKDFAGYRISVMFRCREALEAKDLYPDRFVVADCYRDIGRFRTHEYYLDINGKSYYYKDLLEHWAEVVPKLSDSDEAWVSYFERIVDDMYADGLKQKDVTFNLHRYTFWMADINMRLSLDMLVEISQYIHNFKFGECILEEEETFII